MIKLTEVVQSIVSGKTEDKGKSKKTLEIGCSMLPEIARDYSDRNRTSPFAFTGNKFEFRAVGSSQSIAWPNTILNTIVADSLQYMADAIEAEIKKGT